MLHPKNNRIDYGEQLIPPPGYELYYAIGTTYSLDLEALMVLPVALFYSQNLDASPSEIRNDMLDAITKAASKIAVFCQNGKIKAPKKYHHLMAYWEKGIHEITMPDYVNSFHPKVWVIRFEKKEETPVYRGIITSRNLTYVRDWDVAFSAEGQVGKTEITDNMPLIHFLEFLLKHANLEIPRDFIKDLRKVKFDIPKGFEKLSFFPIGITGENLTFRNPLKTSKWSELLIITPFLDNTTLRSMESTKLFLLSRKEEMDSVPAEVLKRYECYQFSRIIEQAEWQEGFSEEGEEPALQSLHAKLYIGTTNSSSTWFLGSANCTDPAFGRNIEFLVKLESQDPSVSRKNIHKQLTEHLNDNIPLFEPYSRSFTKENNEQTKSNQKLRKLNYKLSRLDFRGKIEKRETAKMYDIVVEVDTTSLTIENDYTVLINPVAEEQHKGLELVQGKIQKLEFRNAYPETILSPFLKVEIFSGKDLQSIFLLRMKIELPDSRLNRIFTAIINSRDKFFRYLQFLLTGEENSKIEITHQEQEHGKTSNGGSGTWNVFGVPIYEKLLLAASRFPEKLKVVNHLIVRIKNETGEDDEPIITQEFESFWTKFINYYESIREDGEGN
ncbi:MAG: phospholipase D family protein [Bacteroidales bacterium]